MATDKCYQTAVPRFREATALVTPSIWGSNVACQCETGSQDRP